MSEAELFERYEKWASIPHLLSARICQSLKAVELTVTRPHPITNKQVSVRQVFQETDRDLLKPIGNPVPLAANVHRVFNRDETKYVDLILDANQNLLSVEYAPSPTLGDGLFIYAPKSWPAPTKLHTKIATNSIAFYPPVLSDEGDVLAYIAEPVIEHQKLPWEHLNAPDPDKPAPHKVEYDRYEYDVNVGNWGEQCEEWHQPQAFVCTLSDGCFYKAMGAEGKAVRQVVISNVGEGEDGSRDVTLLLNVLNTEPRRVGILAFSNRHAIIIKTSMSVSDGRMCDSTEVQIGAHLRAPRDLTINPVDGRLWCVDYGDVQEHHGYGTMVNVMDENAQRSAPLCFPLISRFDKSPWANSDTLYVNQLMEGALVATAVNLSSGQSTLLPIKGSIIAFKKTRVLSRFESAGRIQLHFGGLDSGKPALSLGDISPFKYRHKEHYIILERNGTSPTQNSYRIGLHMHGGPNSAFLSNFSPSIWFLMEACDFDAIVFPNYRGSLSYGVKHTQALAGHVGEYDVADCRLALLREIRSRYLPTQLSSTELASMTDLDLVNACRQHLQLFPAIVAMGASHGGFLTAHLIGQHPLLFKAALAINPVMDAAMHTTDVPDWAAFQFAGPKGIPESAADRWTPEQQDFVRREQFQRSPIRYVKDVRAATFIALGADDLRVDPHQGRNFYHALKELGQCKTVLYQYPKSNHSLLGAEVAAHVYLKGAAFLKSVLQPSSPTKKPKHWVPECLAAQ